MAGKTSGRIPIEWPVKMDIGHLDDDIALVEGFFGQNVKDYPAIEKAFADRSRLDRILKGFLIHAKEIKKALDGFNPPAAK